ncbi:MAG: hypothetical protein HY905_08790 [Deltaproteobacteria bacterium]|nr:hypothetical protein [Deltaproteobacteria bacterium]
MQNKTWYRESWFIVLALVVFPPAGIPLAWFVAPWSKNTKTGAVVASAAWLVIALVVGAVRGPQDHQDADPTTTTTAPDANEGTDAIPPAPNPTTTAAGEPEPPPPPPPSPPAPVPAAPDGNALAVEEPRLLLPSKAGDFELRSPARHAEGVGAVGRYVGAGDDVHLDVELWIRQEDQSLPPPEDGCSAAEVGGQPAVRCEDSGDKYVSLQWRAAAWHFVLDVRYEAARYQRRARAAAQAVADDAATWALRYLGQGDSPSADERGQHLAAVESAVRQGRMEAFKAAVESSGVGAVVRIGLEPADRDGNTLVITVGDGWHVAVKQIRLQAAQDLWRMWADINSASSPDDSRIKLVDLNGNEVGGSRVIGGSMIWVQD